MTTQNTNHEGAKVSFPELHADEGETLPGYNAKQSARILSRLAIERASVAGKSANARAWDTLASVGAEIAGKLQTLRARHALLDSI